MKKINIIFFSIFLILSISCKREKIDFSGQWFVLHMYENKVDVLNNSIRLDTFDVPISRTKFLKIDTNKNVYFFLDRSRPLNAKIINCHKKEIEIKSSEFNTLNNRFIFRLDTIEIIKSGIKGYQVNLTLKSDRSLIYLKKLEKRIN